MEKRSYDAAMVRRILEDFESGYAISSVEFFAAHETDGPSVQHVPPFHRQVWAGFYETWRRMSDSSFAARVERELEYA